jgi:hypothetical protein
MFNRGAKRDYSENSFLRNWLKRKKQSSTHQIANETSSDNDFQYQSLNKSQQTISASTSLTTNITATSPLLSEFESN